ncbi:GNAT family N-acetyltransferase [Enterococcus hulanensis]|uniref:GNAT family N-acetyltransferase n=1 Tax=Enterococcus hulanensis TaxID=2559929 RepID=A0ABU3EWY6_9ENTE|nr:GNAT family N-acetyltransferase [Enterococcus hulanensis]MDT2608599.1 GNAT family N-acetyltransferase [Enterococcus hulanensis]MDT2616354.1 GNAT family N-acetyltransferase [Enterococcus hulanensis]MDT2627606.1 GNAT family N-acetyltransferase [Enterococcus hulanensis]MDT2655636.1 GNAT family N-acetyltransferase [Enterococcus hulanensis]
MDNLENYSIRIDIPEVDEYLALRKVCGLSDRGKDASKIGLSNSIYSVIIRRSADQELVGMGRLIGDGGTAYQIVDIAVHPSEQGKGLAKNIMQLLMTHIENEVDPQAYVNLIADCPADNLYKQFGFVETAPESLGMYLKR